MGDFAYGGRARAGFRLSAHFRVENVATEPIGSDIDTDGFQRIRILPNRIVRLKNFGDVLRAEASLLKKNACQLTGLLSIGLKVFGSESKAGEADCIEAVARERVLLGRHHEGADVLKSIGGGEGRLRAIILRRAVAAGEMR